MKRLISSLLCLTILLGSAGCAVSAPPAESGSGETEPVTLDWYVNYSWYNTPWGGNAVSEAITEKTGVDIRFISPDGSESETLDALIAGGSLPDLVTLGWWETQLTEIVDGGMAYPLNELADQYDPSFWTVADQRRLAWYARPDGNTYCYPNSSYAPEDYRGENRIGSNQTFLVRQDIYEAIGSPDMTTPEGFADAVRAAAERFPTVDGKPLIPIGAHEFTNRGCDSFDLFLMNFLAIPYEKDGRFYDRYTDPEYKRWLAMFRQLGEEGQKLIALGIEGEHYQMVDGRAELTEEVKRLMREDYPAYVAQVGADDTYWMLQDNRMQARWKPLDDPALRQMEEWTYPYTVYTGQYDVSFTPGSEADAADKRLTAIHGEMLPQLLLAPTQEEFEWQWELYISLRESNGLELVLEESTRQMNEAKARLGLS